jgi:ubiquinone/menaquinone biosynthesis C-methylase UbiE
MLNEYLEWSKAWEIDVVMRYMPIVKIFKDVYKPGKKVLEVGAGGNGITNYLDIPITALDLEFSKDLKENKLITKIVASVEKIPLPDKSVDILLSVDMFEHLNSDLRKNALKEFFRVLKPEGFIIIAVPCGKLASFHEKMLNSIYKAAKGKDNHWLIEHINFGLPESDDILKQIKSVKNDCKITVKDNVNVFMWFWIYLFRSFLPLLVRRIIMQAVYPFAKYINILPYRKIFIIS